MKVTILGNNSALPAFGRHPTSQIVSIHGDSLMIDCGEGTQIQMQRFGLKWRKLKHIFISHLHGDHYFGLAGLVNSMSLLGRTMPLHVYGPAELEPMLQAVQDTAGTEYSYPFHFHPLPEGRAKILDDEGYCVSCFPVEHRIACHGFLIESKNKGRKILPYQCREYEIPRYYYKKLKEGEDYERKDGTIIKNEWVTTDGPSPKRYAYCADTLFTQSFLEDIKGANTIYHEATYLHDSVEKAKARFHSTALQAAELAKLAGVEQLLLGHYSSKYKELTLFEEEAKQVFSNVQATVEGSTYDV
ncbi:MAG: ribonuclease Z [Flavipsychrobacter sp.]